MTWLKGGQFIIWGRGADFPQKIQRPSERIFSVGGPNFFSPFGNMLALR